MGRIIGSLGLLVAIAGALLVGDAHGQAIEQGTITVTKTWAAGQEPNEVVEVCFFVSADAAGDEVLGEACHAEPRPNVEMSAEGPGDLFRQDTTNDAGVVVFYGFVEPGEVTIAEGVPTGDYAGFVVGCELIETEEEVPIEYRTNGRAAFVFDLPTEVVDADAGVLCEWYNIPAAPPEPTASLTIHKSSCQADVAPVDRYELCHDIGLVGVDFVLEGPVNLAGTTAGHLGAVNWTDLPAGLYTVAEAAPSGEFVDYAVFCSRTDTHEQVPFEKLGDGRAAIRLEVGAGAQVVCDWYSIAPVEVPLLDFRIAAFTCPTDPGTVSLAAGNIPEACDPKVGAAFTVTSPDGTFLAECTTGANGMCVVQLPNEASVVVTEDVTTIPAGYAPRENPIATEVRTEFAGALFINLPIAPPTPTVPAPTATPAPTSTPTPTPVPVVGRPVHVHAGTCADLAREPRYPLTDLTTPEATPEGAPEAAVAEASYTVIDVSLDDLLAEPHAINAHLSREEMAVYVVCGEIGGPRRSDGSIVVGLRELNGSGLTGIAYLVPDPNDPERTRVSVFLAPGLAEEDPTLLPPASEAVVIHAVVDTGPVAPEFQAGYEITIDGTGRAEIVLRPQGSSPGLAEEDRTAEEETYTVQLSDEELRELLAELDALGFFDLTQVDEIDPEDLLVGGPTSRLTVTLVDGTWDVDGNGLSAEEAALLEEAQQLVAEAVGGVEVPTAG